MRALILFTLYLVSLQAFSQKQNNEGGFLTDDRHWTIEVPPWLPGFKGNLEYDNIRIDGDYGLDPPTSPGLPENLPEDSNIFKRLFKSNSNLRLLFIGRVAFQSEKLLIQTDFMGGSISSSLNFVYNDIELVKADIFSSLGRAYIGYELLEWRSDLEKTRLQLYGYMGTRITYFRFYSELNDPNKNLSVQNTWLSTLVGIQFQLDLDNWQFLLSNDLGGFNINNRISYSNQLTVYYRICNLVSIRTGWYDMDIKYKGNVKEKDLSWNTHLSGPSLGIGFHF